MVTTAGGNPPSTVDEKLAAYQELCNRRESIADRLRKVEDEKASVSPRIYEKVRGDYEKELAKVADQIEPLKGALEQMRRTVDNELAALDDAIREKEDVIAEAEFRRRVGEYTEAEYTEATAEINRVLEMKRRERETIEERLRAFDRRRASRDPDGEVEAPPTAAPAPAPATPPAPEVPPAPAHEPAFAAEPAEPGEPTVYDIDPLPATPPADNADWLEPPSETASPGGVPAGSPSKNEGDDVSATVDEWFMNPASPADTKDPAGAVAEPATAVAEPVAPAPAEPETDEDPLAALSDAQKRDEAASVAEDTSGGMPGLVVQTGSHKGRTIPLLPMTMSIGREHDNNIELKDPDVARYHSRLVFENGGFSIEDLESSSGTFVNGEKAISAPLKHGDRIRLGSTELVYEIA